MPDHYFSAVPASPSERRTIRVRLAGRDLDVTTANGIFSPGHVDLGTEVLLRTVPPLPATGTFLDLGAGWGPVALSMALAAPEADVWAVDVNERALDLVQRNAAAHGCDRLRASLPDGVPDDVRPDVLWSNPPIRIGKDALHALLEHWLPRLADGGSAWLVVQRNLGADSLHRWLAEDLAPRAGLGEVERVASAKGFRVLRVAAGPTA